MMKLAAEEGADPFLVRRLSEKFCIPVIQAGQAVPDGEPVLLIDREGLTLISGSLRLRADLTGMARRLKPHALRGELLVRAAGLGKGNGGKTITAVDATAGLGEDALLLAAGGCEVLLFERDPLIAELLRDALRKAALSDGLRDAAERMHFREGDSLRGLSELETPPDVVYLDPMFPERRKSGLVGKKLQLFQMLERPCPDEAELFEAAVKACPGRIVVKRPLKGPHLDGRKPSWSLGGKAVRFDVYSFPR